MPILPRGFDPAARLVHAFILFLGLIGIVWNDAVLKRRQRTQPISG